MLALTRKINESIIIDDNIEITILEVKGDQVKIGISAPKSIAIYRKELYLEIKDSNKEAANSVDIINNLKDIFK